MVVSYVRATIVAEATNGTFGKNKLAKFIATDDPVASADTAGWVIDGDEVSQFVMSEHSVGVLAMMTARMSTYDGRLVGPLLDPEVSFFVVFTVIVVVIVIVVVVTIDCVIVILIVVVMGIVTVFVIVIVYRHLYRHRNLYCYRGRCGDRGRCRCDIAIGIVMVVVIVMAMVILVFIVITGRSLVRRRHSGDHRRRSHQRNVREEEQAG